MNKVGKEEEFGGDKLRRGSECVRREIFCEGYLHDWRNK